MKNRILAGVAALALASCFATLRAGEAKKVEAKPATATPAMEQPTYRAACPSPCEFTVQGHDRKEVAAILKEHAKSHHDMDMPDKVADDMIKDVGPKK